MRKIKFLNWVFVLFMCSNSYAQTAGSGTDINVLNNDNFEGFEILDSAITKARVIMTGENHTYVNFNSKMELKMLRYLNKQFGLKDFIIELGGARAHFLNRYINEADTLAELYLKATTSPRYMDLFKRMRKFNMGLPDSMRITVHGIDVERFNDLPLMRLAELLPDSMVPSRLYTAVDAVEMASAHMVRSGVEDYETARDETKYGRYNRPTFYVGLTINEFIRYYDSLKPDFKNWLGPKFAQVEEAVHWLREYKQWREYENTTYQYIWREEGIYTHLSQLVRSNATKRFYGEFGRCHVAYQEQNGDCGWYGYHSVINKMKSRYFKNADSVLTLGIFYSGNSDNNYYSDREDDEGIQEEINEMVDNTDKKTVTLFDLRNEDVELPLLSKKFSYAIVNNHYIMEDEDSLDSEVITYEDKDSKEFEPYYFYTAGFSLSNINRDVLGNHISLNGRSTDIAPIGLIQFSYGGVGTLVSEVRFGWMPAQKLVEDTNGVLSYGAYMADLHLGYPFIKRKNLQFDIGFNSAYGRERISLVNDNISFLNARADKYFVHSAFVIGPSANMHIKLGQFFYLGAHVSRMVDLSSGQWNYRGSKQNYGEKGAVTAGFSGFYYGAKLGISIPIESGYSYTDYTTQE